jgi:ribonuclease HI
VKVLLYTDASVMQGVGAWGVVALRVGMRPLQHAAIMRDPTKSSTHTEIRAVANGLHLAMKSGHIQPGDEVELRCDCQSVVGILNGAAFTKRVTAKRAASREQLQQAAQVVRDMLAKRGCTMTAVWIKGHASEANGDHGLQNRWCDMNARRVAKAEVKKREATKTREAAARKHAARAARLLTSRVSA